MKIIFFGGTGGIGRETVTELCGFPEIQRLTLAARSRQRYSRLAEQIPSGGDKLDFLPVDIDQEQDFTKILAGYDLVANAAGPFYRYEHKMAREALKSGINYVSICDDFDAAQEVFRLDQAFRSKGLLAVTGIGWTPGLSSLLTRYGADKLDSVQKINIAWAGNTADSMGLAVILHVLHIFNNQVPSFQAGGLRLITAGSGKETVMFPKPLGSVNVYHVGHPEPVTMKKYFPGAREITLKGGINEDFLNKLAIIAGRFNIGKSKLAHPTAAFFRKTLPWWRRISGGAPALSGIKVTLTGTSRGKSSRAAYSAVGPMEVLTGLPMAIAIRELARGNIRATGVLAPEAPDFLNPPVFFTELNKRGIKIVSEEF